MTVDALAARAGVDKPTIYLRWPGGKAAVVADGDPAHKTRSPATPTPGSLRGDLLALVRESIAHVAARTSTWPRASIVQLRESPELAEIFREHEV